MRSIELWRASALLAALVRAGAAGAQPPEQKKDPARVFPEAGRLAADDIIEHILSFDKNKDGKVSKDELPERMQDLIAKVTPTRTAPSTRARFRRWRPLRAGSVPAASGSGSPVRVRVASRDLVLAASRGSWTI